MHEFAPYVAPLVQLKSCNRGWVLRNFTCLSYDLVEHNCHEYCSSDRSVSCGYRINDKKEFGVSVCSDVELVRSRAEWKSRIEE